MHLINILLQNGFAELLIEKKQVLNLTMQMYKNLQNT